MVDSTYSSAREHKCLLILATCFLAISFSGCRNCGQTCVPQQYTPYNTAPAQFQQFQQPAAGFGGSGTVNPVPAGYGYNNTNAAYNSTAQARIQAPSTYSLNIPGVNNNANGLRVGQLPSGLLNTQQTAPTPVNRPANYNQQQGWRRSDGNDLNTSSTNQTGDTNRVADSSGASSVLVSSAGTNGSTARTASTANAVGTGVSFTQSTDYRTTSTDERRDNSRLPVTDATNVRVTSSIAQTPNASGQNTQPYYQPRYASLPPTTTYQGAFVRPDYSASPQTYQGSFSQQFAAPAAQPQQQVLAQSTARYDPYQATASTASSDWRDRGRESNSF